jgi:hypothetical protein
LCGVTDAVDVNYIVFDSEENSIDVPVAAGQSVSEVDAQNSGFVGFRPLVRII